MVLHRKHGLNVNVIYINTDAAQPVAIGRILSHHMPASFKCLICRPLTEKGRPNMGQKGKR